MSPKRKEHCWHHTGITMMSDPPQGDERCCHCGKVERITQSYVRPQGCGEFAELFLRPKDHERTACPGSPPHDG